MGHHPWTIIHHALHVVGLSHLAHGPSAQDLHRTLHVLGADTEEAVGEPAEHRKLLMKPPLPPPPPCLAEVEEGMKRSPPPPVCPREQQKLASAPKVRRVVAKKATFKLPKAGTWALRSLGPGPLGKGREAPTAGFSAPARPSAKCYGSNCASVERISPWSPSGLTRLEIFKAKI